MCVRVCVCVCACVRVRGRNRDYYYGRRRVRGSLGFLRPEVFSIFEMILMFREMRFVWLPLSIVFYGPSFFDNKRRAPDVAVSCARGPADVAGMSDQVLGAHVASKTVPPWRVGSS